MELVGCGQERPAIHLYGEKWGAAPFPPPWGLDLGGRIGNCTYPTKFILKSSKRDLVIEGVLGLCDLIHISSLFLSPTPVVSLDSVLQDVRGLQRGMELTRKEFMRQDDSVVLKEFLKANTEVMEKLQTDSKTAQVRGRRPHSHGSEPFEHSKAS